MILPLKSNFFYMVILEVNQFPQQTAKINYSIYNLPVIATPSNMYIHITQIVAIPDYIMFRVSVKRTKTIKRKHYYFLRLCEIRVRVETRTDINFMLWWLNSLQRSLKWTYKLPAVHHEVYISSQTSPLHCFVLCQHECLAMK